jgi:hypothetical protein
MSKRRSGTIIRWTADILMDSHSAVRAVLAALLRSRHGCSRHALQSAPAGLSQTLPQSLLHRLPGWCGPPEDPTPGGRQLDMALPPVAAGKATDPACLLEWRECAAQGSAVRRQDVRQGALGDGTRAGQHLQQRELGGSQSLWSERGVVELGHGPGGAPEVGTGATQRDEVVTAAWRRAHNSMLVHAAGQCKMRSMALGRVAQ